MVRSAISAIVMDSASRDVGSGIVVMRPGQAHNSGFVRMCRIASRLLRAAGIRGNWVSEYSETPIRIA